jgi:hypothetical protein
MHIIAIVTVTATVTVTVAVTVIAAVTVIVFSDTGNDWTRNETK